MSRDDYRPSLRCQHGVRWHLTCNDCDEAKEFALKVRAAHVLLDRCREGIDVPALDVSRALRLLGEAPTGVRRAAA